MNEGGREPSTGAAELDSLARSARRAGCWALLSAAVPLLTLFYTVRVDCHGACAGGQPLWLGVGAITAAASLWSAWTAQQAAALLRCGDRAGGALLLARAALTVTIPALLVLAPLLLVLVIVLRGLILVKTVDAGQPGSGCAEFVLLVLLLYCGIAGLYVVPALVAGSLARSAARAIRGTRNVAP
jgi:hypothetical protein